MGDLSSLHLAGLFLLGLARMSADCGQMISQLGSSCQEWSTCWWISFTWFLILLQTFSNDDEKRGRHKIEEERQTETEAEKVSVQFNSVAQSCSTLCDPVNRSTPGLPVHDQHLEFTQTHVHGVGDAIQPSHPLSPPSPPALKLSQHQGLFKWVSSLHQVVFSNESVLCIVSASTSVLPMGTQEWPPLGWTGWIFLQSKALSRVFSNTTVQKHQFFSSQLSL